MVYRNHVTNQHSIPSTTTRERAGPRVHYVRHAHSVPATFSPGKIPGMVRRHRRSCVAREKRLDDEEDVSPTKRTHEKIGGRGQCKGGGGHGRRREEVGNGGPDDGGRAHGGATPKRTWEDVERISEDIWTRRTLARPNLRGREPRT